ncbi:hypothetical protein KC19_5G152800 [Ceratodon purpureus]|uniref:Uncharacterized protein n=1 Tax=Ceratodon purpureus TaxID=3225 RepID=A0A8T0I3M5_CERPU|nr:hypothetical protein KC19_5G152800 [Ceratodon purpureus]
MASTRPACVSTACTISFKFKTGKMSESSSSAEVDYLDLCEKHVCSLASILATGENLVNQGQCQDLSSKLSKITQNVQELVLCSEGSVVYFHLALKNLYRYLEKAKALVSSCAQENWLAAAVFQIQNESTFREILLDAGLCYNAIYELAKSRSIDWNDHLPEDLRQSSVFEPASDTDIDNDKRNLQKRLDDLANGYTEVNRLDYWIPGRVARRQSLAKYLLEKMCYTPLQPQLDTYSAILWRKVSEPSGTWGSSRFLGAGSGASGVCSTTWLGIPCAKKEFHGEEIESIFLKEAGILAHLRHPCIVDMICCGNGLERGDRFIAMELMERSLFDLIQEQKGVPFPLSVAVDMMVQMARGVRYLHERGVAHRDLKPQNVVVKRLSLPHVEDHFGVKLVDFGISKVKVEASKSNTMTYSGIGTTMYRAPEAHPMANPGGGAKVNWFKADAFSFAMTCAHVLTLKVPFNGLSSSELYKEVCKNARRPDLRDMCPEELILLLKDCWKSNPLSRPSFVEICTRLETFKYNDQVVDKDKMDSGLGLDFIKQKFEGESLKERAISLAEDEGMAFDLQLPILLCGCGRALEPLPQSLYRSGRFICNICWEEGQEEVYHCENCQFDAHPECAMVKEQVEVFFHDHPLHLLVKNYYNERSDATCYFCKESVQGSDWVYWCEECDLDVHALCAKYPKEKPRAAFHYHSLTLRQYLPLTNLSCACCDGEVRTNSWRYTCVERWCAYDVHPNCTILATAPLCMFDGSHRLDLVKYPSGFHCSKCGSLGVSCFYHCEQCNVDIHLECLDNVVDHEGCRIKAYEEFIQEYGTEAKPFGINMITELLEKFYGRDSLDGSLSSTSSPTKPPGGHYGCQGIFLKNKWKPISLLFVLLHVVVEGCATSLEPIIHGIPSFQTPDLDAIDFNDELRRKIFVETAERIAKRMTSKTWRKKLNAKSLEMLKNLEKMILDLRSSGKVLQGDEEVFALALEKVQNEKEIEEEEMALQMQSRMRRGPRTCLFYVKNEERGVNELLTNLRSDRKDLCIMFLCEEPGQEHSGNDFMVAFYRVLEEEFVHKVPPLFTRGLRVVAKVMSALPSELTQLDSVTLPIFGSSLPWDLQAMDFEKHGKILIDKENANELERAEDSAAQLLLSNLENDDTCLCKDFGLLRVRYKGTEKSDCSRYSRGSVAWLCKDHVNRGLKDGILESYPMKYYNPELN